MRVRTIAVVTMPLALAAMLGCAPVPVVCPQPAAPAPPPPGEQRSVDHHPGEHHPGEHPHPAEEPAAKAAKPPEEHHVYRLDFVVASNDAGKPVTSSTYSLNLEEEQSGDLRLGTNVPLVAPSPGTKPGAPVAAPRQDVGLNLRAFLRVVGEDLLLHTAFEMSYVEDPSTIHKIASNGDALVSPGKPAVLCNLEDPSSHKHYQVTVTATSCGDVVGKEGDGRRLALPQVRQIPVLVPHLNGRDRDVQGPCLAAFFEGQLVREGRAHVLLSAAELDGVGGREHLDGGDLAPRGR